METVYTITWIGGTRRATVSARIARAATKRIGQDIASVEVHTQPREEKT